MNAIGYSLEEVIVRCKSTGVVSKYLIHQIRGNVKAPRGSAIKLATISEKFLEARRLAGYTADNEPTFHEIRSLSKRTYMEQDGVDTKALLGHLTDAMADLYANSRGLEPLKVKISGRQLACDNVAWPILWSAPMTDTFELNVSPGGPGAEGLAAICQQVRASTNAKCAAVIVLDGTSGSGYSVIGPLEAQVLLPSILEQMANALRSQLKPGLQ
jgi:hypothetical protein